MNLTEKIFIKAYAMSLNKNKRLHFATPNHIEKTLNQLQIWTVLGGKIINTKN